VLPESADTQVISGGIDDLPVIQLAAATSGDQEQAAEVLRTVVVPELERLEGVRDVQLSGVQDRFVRIDVDLAALAEAGVDPTAIADALRANGAVVPGGTITEDDRTLSVETGARLTSAEDVAALPVPTEAGPVLVGDIAEVSAERAEATSFNRTDGDPSF